MRGEPDPHVHERREVPPHERLEIQEPDGPLGTDMQPGMDDGRQANMQPVPDMQPQCTDMQPDMDDGHPTNMQPDMQPQGTDEDHEPQIASDDPYQAPGHTAACKKTPRKRNRTGAVKARKRRERVRGYNRLLAELSEESD